MAQVCSALDSLEHEVTLIAPGIWTPPVEDPFAYYGVPRSFAIERLPVFDALQAWYVPGKLAFRLTMRSYAQALAERLRERSPDLLYVRSPTLLRPLLRSGIPIILEVHTLPRFGRRVFAALCNRCRLVACLTSPQREALIALGVDPKRLIVEPDGVDVRRFAHVPSASEAKTLFRLPVDRPVIAYVGSLTTQDTIEKGIAEFIASIGELQKRGIRVQGWIVGGPEPKRRHYQEKTRQSGIGSDVLQFEGGIAPTSVPIALAACDVLVYPAPASMHPYFQRDTSPLKLYEYLAARRPVVCADLPPLHDMVSEREVFFCPPGNGTSMADAIGAILRNPGEAEKRVQAGFVKVQEHSWKKRMARILRHVNNDRTV